MVSDSSRIYGLDILRASAIILVLLTHGVYYFTDSWNVFFLNKFFPDGVSIFFVLSGFLIGKILIRTINKKDFKFQDVKDFWIRRWFRTLPAYYFVLSLLIGSSWLMNSAKRPLWEYIKYFLFFQAFQSGNCSVYMESWSLCVEEFFYISIPIFLFCCIKLTKSKIKEILAFCISLVILAGTLFTIYKINYHHYSTNEEWDIFIRKTVFTRLSSIMYGFLGAYLMFYHSHLWRHKTIFLIAGLIIFLFLSIRPVFNIGPFFNFEQLSLESIATLLLIPALSSIQQGRGLLFTVLTFVSRISYSIYLINFTPYYLVETEISLFFNIHSTNYAFVRLMLFLVWSVGVGYLMYQYVERPLMKKRKFSAQKNDRNIVYSNLE